jgi:hypothetical protein
LGICCSASASTGVPMGRWLLKCRCSDAMLTAGCCALVATSRLLLNQLLLRWWALVTAWQPAAPTGTVCKQRLVGSRVYQAERGCGSGVEVVPEDWSTHVPCTAGAAELQGVSAKKLIKRCKGPALQGGCRQWCIPRSEVPDTAHVLYKPMV